MGRVRIVNSALISKRLMRRWPSKRAQSLCQALKQTDSCFSTNYIVDLMSSKNSDSETLVFEQKSKLTYVHTWGYEEAKVGTE